MRGCLGDRGKGEPGPGDDDVEESELGEGEIAAFVSLWAGGNWRGNGDRVGWERGEFGNVVACLCLGRMFGVVGRW